MAKKKPPNAGKGRTPGAQNKVTRTFKMAIINAFERGGGEDWLLKLMKEDKRTFAMLIAKVMPTQVVGDVSYRYIARIPAPEKNNREWLEKYAPSPPKAEPTKH